VKTPFFGKETEIGLFALTCLVAKGYVRKVNQFFLPMYRFPAANRFLFCLVPVMFFFVQTRAQNACHCRTKKEISTYEKRIDTIVNESEGCDSCMILTTESLLVYDAACKKMLFRDAGHPQLKVLTDLNDLELHYKRPFRFKLVNFNRYIYNLNYASADIAFTSSMPQVMQQYLFPTSGSAQVTPANTFTNGSSENGGAYVFANIAAFRANMDQLLAKVMATTLPQSALVETRKYSVFLKKIADLVDSFAKKNPTVISKSDMTVINTYSDIIINSPDFNLSGRKFIDKADSARTGDSARSKVFDDFLQASKSTLQVIAASKKNPKLEKNAQVLLDSLQRITRDAQQSKYEDSVLTVLSVRTHNNALNVLDSVFALDNYCDSFIDDRIIAYSLCTNYDSLKCCQPQKRYDHIDSLMEKVSKAIYLFKEEKTIYDSTKAFFSQYDDQQAKAAAAAATPKPKPGDKAQPSPKDSSKPLVIKPTSTDYVFTNGTLTGLKIKQLADTSKPKPSPSPADPFTLIDSLWNQFEKNISTDYIMRQIIFHNNLVKQNLTYTSPPIYPYGDRLGLVMQITPSDSMIKMGTAPIQSEAISLDFTVSDRPLFSFSAGTFAGIGLNSKTYEWQQIPSAGSNTIQSNSPYTLVKTGNGSAPIGFDGMANVTWPWFLSHCKWARNNIRLGISGGVGAVVTPTPIRIGYLIGGTASVGLYQQFHFSAGVNFMNVNTKKDDLNNSYIYSSNPGIDVYNQKIGVGAFISISYTIFSPKSSGAANVNSASAPAVNSTGSTGTSTGSTTTSTSSTSTSTPASK
jgi:hypothetical protein